MMQKGHAKRTACKKQPAKRTVLFAALLLSLQKGQSFSQPYFSQAYFLTLLSHAKSMQKESMQKGQSFCMQKGQSFSQAYFLTLLSRLGNSST
jgi:hypothetical protein